QSVMGSFFVRAAAGQYDLDKPDQLVKLLVVMARNKLASQSRKAQVVRRKDQPSDPDSGGPPEIMAPGASPSEQVAARDLLDELRRRLSQEGLQLADRRGQGQEWAQIAAEVGGSPEALRKKLPRALDRAVADLGLEDPGQE